MKSTFASYSYILTVYDGQMGFVCFLCQFYVPVMIVSPS